MSNKRQDVWTFFLKTLKSAKIYFLNKTVSDKSNIPFNKSCKALSGYLNKFSYSDLRVMRQDVIKRLPGSIL